MNNKLFHMAVFAAGVAVGSVVTWKVLKTKCEERIQEEIDSVKEAFSRQSRVLSEEAENTEKDDDSQEPATSPSAKPSLADYAKMLSEEGYTDYTEIDTKQKGGSTMPAPAKPYVIPPDEYGDEADYDMVELRYFEAGILTDSWCNIIDDESAEEMIGLESLKHFGEYEEDSVHVRNDLQKTDYEILAAPGRYADIDLSDPDSVDE